MSDFFLGEIRLFAFGFAPLHWHFCDGAQLAVAQNQALYSLLGFQYGGNNSTLFALPDLRGRTPVHRNVNEVPGRIVTQLQGSVGGAESVVLAPGQMPSHQHTMFATSAAATLATAVKPTAPTQANRPAASVKTGTNPNALPLYIPPSQSTATQTLDPNAIATSGASTPHENRQPYLAANYCISLTGDYPTRP